MRVPCSFIWIASWPAAGAPERPLQFSSATWMVSSRSTISLDILKGIECSALIVDRSEEHTSELQSRPHLVCRLLLEKKKNRPQLAVAPRRAGDGEHGDDLGIERI